MPISLLLSLLAAAVEPVPAEPPSLAVFSLVPAEAISEGVAKLLTDSLTQSFRSSKAFSRVVSAAEIEAMMGFERTKQLASCDSTSCASELANALGVDVISVGNIGKIGNSVLMNLKLLDVKRGRTISSISERIAGGNEEALLDRLPAVTQTLLVDAGLMTAPAAPPPTPPAPPPLASKPPEPPPSAAISAPVPPEPPAARPSQEPAPSGSWSIPMLAGAVALGLGALALVPVTVGLAVASYWAGGAIGFLVLYNLAGAALADANTGGNVIGGLTAANAALVGLGLSAVAVVIAIGLVVLARP